MRIAGIGGLVGGVAAVHGPTEGGPATGRNPTVREAASASRTALKALDRSATVRVASTYTSQRAVRLAFTECGGWAAERRPEGGAKRITRRRPARMTSATGARAELRGGV